MKRLIYLWFFLVVPAATAQTYQVKEVNFKDNEEVFEYFKKTESQHLILYSDVAKSSLANELKMMRYNFAQNGNKLEATQTRGDKSYTLELEKTGKTTYVKETKTQRYEADFKRDDRPALFLEKYVSLEETKGHSDAFQKLSKKYGETVTVYRVELVLEEVTKEDLTNELHIEKSFEVAAVSVRSDEEARALAEEFLDTRLYNPYHTYGQNTLDRTFVGMKYKIRINGPAANVKAGAISFSSPIEKINAKRYRVELGRAYYDFIVDSVRDNVSFNVVKVEYAEYIPPKDEYKDTPAYQALSEKYGEKIPYVVVTQQVEEVSGE